MVESRLRQAGLSLWTTGNAPGMRNFDDDLVKTIGALHARYSGLPEISITFSADEPVERTGTHQIHFGGGGAPFLSVTVNVDLTMGTADILSHTTPETVDLNPDAYMDPAEKLLRDFGKRKTEPETAGKPEPAPSSVPEPAPAAPGEVTPVPDPAAPAAGEANPAPPPVPEKVSEEPRKGDE